MSTRIRRTTMLLVTAAAAAAIGLTIAAPPQPSFGATLGRPGCGATTFVANARVASSSCSQNDNSQGNNNNQGENGAPVAKRKAAVS
jgi:hypothetical protein